MTYSIGEISKTLHIPISTLRFYDKEGLLLNIERDKGGLRRFNEQTIEALRVIECLKKSGMQIKDIKEFMYWVSQGDKTISKRKEMFLRQKENIENKIKELNEALNMINFKCWYYEKAENDKTEKNIKNINIDNMPPEIKTAYENSHLK